MPRPRPPKPRARKTPATERRTFSVAEHSKPKASSLEDHLDRLSDKSVKSDAWRPPNAALLRKDQERRKLERQREILQATILGKHADLSARSFWYFVTQVIYPDVWEKHYTEKFHKPLVDRIGQLKRGEDFWLFLFREARKTFLFTLAHTIWRIVQDPDIRILLIGAREETVKPFARFIRSAFVPGTPGFERFQQVYPDFVFQQGDKHLQQTFQFTCRLRTKTLPDPSFRASYLGVTGAGWRCDILDFDDPIERRNVTTPEQSVKSLGQMLDLLPLVDQTSPYRNIIGKGTRWAYHDPYGAILGEGHEEEDLERAEAMEALATRRKKVHIFVRHCAEDSTRSCEECSPEVVREYPHGHPVSPHDPNAVPAMAPIHSLEDLQEKLAQYAMDPNRGESLWFHQYQNVCMAPSDQKFDDGWFLDYEYVSWTAPHRKVLAIDSASKDFQQPGRGDFMVALMGDWNDHGRLCIRYGLRSNRWTKDEFIRRITSWCEKSGWWPSYAIKEKFGEDTFQTDVKLAFSHFHRPVNAMTVSRPTQLKKYDWIVESLQGPMERGEICFGRGVPLPLRQRLQYELTALSQVAHDDVADTLALFMAEDVRVKRVDRPRNPNNMVRPPALNLYNPNLGRSHTPDPDITDVGRASIQPRIQSAFATLDPDGSNVIWDRGDKPQFMPLPDGAKGSGRR